MTPHCLPSPMDRFTSLMKMSSSMAILATLFTVPPASHAQEAGDTWYFNESGQPVWRDSEAVQECEQAMDDNRPNRAQVCGDARFAGPPEGTAADILAAKGCPYEMLGIEIASRPMAGRDGCVNGDYLSPDR